MESSSPIHNIISSSSNKSPEFEFCNPSPATLHSADQLFSRGFLLPLHHLLPPQPEPEPEPEPDPSPQPQPETETESVPSASIMSAAGNPILTASKRWKDIFKRSDKNKPPEKKKEKKNGKNINVNNNNNNNSNNNVNNSTTAELNIKLWPFSRSRSAGNNSGRARPAVSTGRKVSSAPCSRSNSSGESKSRRAWPNSPGRAGVYLGRASPVWQVRKGRTNSDECRRSKVAGKGRVLNLNVPMCMGYRQQLSCRSDENEAVSGGGYGGRNGVGGGGGNDGNLFGFRGLFSKKSVLTV